jgi:hypothetical protein
MPWHWKTLRLCTFNGQRSVADAGMCADLQASLRIAMPPLLPGWREKQFAFLQNLARTWAQARPEHSQLPLYRCRSARTCALGSGKGAQNLSALFLGALAETSAAHLQTGETASRSSNSRVPQAQSWRLAPRAAGCRFPTFPGLDTRTAISSQHRISSKASRRDASVEPSTGAKRGKLGSKVCRGRTKSFSM